MQVIVAGASGYIGRHVVAELTRRGHSTVALVRRTPDAALAAYLADARIVEVSHIDRDGLCDVAPALAGSDALISCIAAASGRADDAWAVDHDMNMALLAFAQETGLSHVQLLSALCVQRPVLAFQKAKHAFEQALLAADMPCSIIRPTAFFKSLAGQIPRVRAGKAFLLFGNGPGPACLPISEDDLAAFMVDVLETPGRWGQILPVGGPGAPVTPQARGEMLFTLANTPPRFKRIPLRLVDTIGWGLGRLARLSKRAANGAEYARIARFFATEPMLVHDPSTGMPNAHATPQYGSTSLTDFYKKVWQDGLDGQHLGDAALFDHVKRD